MRASAWSWRSRRWSAGFGVMAGARCWIRAWRASSSAVKCVGVGAGWRLAVSARCSDCGACFRVHTQHLSTARGKTPYQYYRCNNNQERINQPRCASKLVRAEAVDEAVWGHLTRLLTQPGLLRAEIERVIGEEQRKQPSAEAAIKELDGQRAPLRQRRDLLALAQ